MALSTLSLCLSFICCLLALGQAQEITYTILEEQEAHSVGNLAGDLNIQTTSATRFQFLTATWENQTYFDLNVETGDISTTQSIDREIICALNSDAICQYELEVLVLPQSTYRFIRVHVIIEDINDHTPSFSKTVLSLATSETVQVGTKIPLETAKDADVGINSVQDYTLINDSGKFGLSIQRNEENIISLQLEVTAELDRETRSSYLLTLQAHDGGDTPNTGSVMLNVTILDSNDNAPQFQRSSYSVNIEENIEIGTEILKVEAMDPDIGTNGQIEYSFSSSVSESARQALEINEVTGMISVKGIIDYEKQQSFQLTVEASNRVTNPVPDFTTVTINIIDVNDNYPILTVTPLDEEANLWVYLPENTQPGMLVAFIKASDPDEGGSGMVRISLSNTLSDFGLQEVSVGQYFLSTLRTLDREAVDVYNISIQAMDQGSPVKTTVRHLVIAIGDINDNAPYFVTPVYYANVDENNDLSLPLVTISAKDADEGSNSEISYQLWTQTDAFAVGVSTGLITAEAVLDREAQSTISLLLSACDHGVPMLCSNTTVVINVQDVNDNQPTFMQAKYQFSIVENESVDTIVGYTKATDMDTGHNAQLTYSIRDEDFNRASDFFHIVAQTGKILTSKTVDREEYDEFKFIVTVTDHGVTPQTSEVLVSITVQDENDNAPHVISPTIGNDTFFTPQAAVAGFPVLSINAFDPDQGVNSQLSYSISSGNTEGIFGITTVGQLITVQKIANTWEGVHELTIQISDGGSPRQTTNLELIVVITDLDFNISLPARIFFEQFNLTADDFGLQNNDDKEQHTSPLASWPVITAIIMGSLVMLLLIIFILVYFKCHFKPKPEQIYTGPPELARSSSCKSSDFSTGTNSSPARKLSTDSSHVSVPTSLSSIPSKNIMKWRGQAVQANGMLDCRLGNHQMTTFGSNLDILSDTSARQTPDTDAEVQRLLTILRMETDAVSDNSNRSSYDSGQGDHDESDSTQDVFPSRHYIHRTPRSSSCPRLSGTGQGHISSRDHYMASPNCTPECATLGHSDQCWNQTQQPCRPRSASAGVTSQQPIHRPISLYANSSSGYTYGLNTPIRTTRLGSNEDYDHTTTTNYPRNSTYSSPATDSYQNESYDTFLRQTAVKASTANDVNEATPLDHVNNKHHRNSTPLILSPITEDPMEITANEQNDNCYGTLGGRCHGSKDKVLHPTGTLVQHKNSIAYNNRRKKAVQSRHDVVNNAEALSSGYYSPGSIHTCL